MEQLRYLPNVSTLQIIPENCTGCGVCVDVCPHRVLALENKKISILDKDACMECGACQMNCAFDAITVNKGVGCAYAIIKGKLLRTEPECGCAKEACC